MVLHPPDEDEAPSVATEVTRRFEAAEAEVAVEAQAIQHPKEPMMEPSSKKDSSRSDLMMK